ncbi:uncharacterized protein LOC132199214 isoform X1 [Neocloeon triangulifer]|uniref:uncharacterized protein LOC132199214 isoform X1 n=1 Tax=Neocloeon triangulifer TaxID=2078957 RepID=UPI00286F8F58|nr:uncharacterized protein LOC132199214 isoform X1 [Neocloeon triangulifer]
MLVFENKSKVTLRLMKIIVYNRPLNNLQFLNKAEPSEAKRMDKPLILLLCVLIVGFKNSCSGYEENIERSTESTTMIVEETSAATEEPEVEEIIRPSIDFRTIINKYQERENPSENVQTQEFGFMKNLQEIYSSGFLTDRTFLVGPDGEVEKIKAHAVILAASSKLFKFAMKEETTTFRIDTIAGAEFRKLMNFIYSGAQCVTNIEEACVLLKHANTFGLSAISEVARSFLFSKIYYSYNTWDVYKCADEVKDQTLKNAILKILSNRTNELAKDEKFSLMTQEDLIKFVQFDNMNIKGEIELYQIIIRWALRKVYEKGLEKKSEVLREIIGVDILKNIRFLSMSIAEFQKVYLGFKILTYEEALSITFNIDKYNSIYIPDSISPISTPRTSHSFRNPNESFEMIGVPDPCKPKSDNHRFFRNRIDNNDIYTTLTQSEIPKSRRRFHLRGIQIPRRVSVAGNILCSSAEEHFDIIVFDFHNNTVSETTHNQIPKCENDSHWDRKESETNDCLWKRVRPNRLINIKLDVQILPTVPTIIDYFDDDADSADDIPYKVKVIPRQTARYPLTLSSLIQTSEDGRRCSDTNPFKSDFSAGSYYYLDKSNFIYSMILEEL